MLFYLHLCSLYTHRPVGKRGFFKRVSCCFPRLRVVRVTLHDQLIRYTNEKKKINYRYSANIPKNITLPTVDDLIRHFIKPIMCPSYLYFFYDFHDNLSSTVGFIIKYLRYLLLLFFSAVIMV